MSVKNCLCLKPVCAGLFVLSAAWSIAPAAAPLVWGAGAWGDQWAVLNDWDGDGVPNVNDAFPVDPAEWSDTDMDGIGNNADLDDDGDNVPDYIDADPLDPGVATERTLPVDGIYRGSVLGEEAAIQ